MRLPRKENDKPGKIFVGGLDHSVDEEGLEKSFAKYGRITESKCSIQIS